MGCGGVLGDNFVEHYIRLWGVGAVLTVAEPF